MVTPIVKIDPHRPAPEQIALAAQIVKNGGLVAFPTETVYGLGASALNSRAVRRIFAVKRRPAANPLIVHISGKDQMAQIAGELTAAADELADRFWPGPLTLVVRRGAHVPDEITANGPTVAVRMPAHSVARALIRAAGVPLAAPSANRSGQLSPTTAEHVAKDLDGLIDLILDAGPCDVGVESTVLDMTVTPPQLLRPGAILPREIMAVIGPISLSPPGDATVLRSPGLLKKHYSPVTPLECIGRSRDRIEELAAAGKRAGWLVFEGTALPAIPLAVSVEMPQEPRAYAARLYAVLHRLDGLGLDCIVVEAPPESDEWLAVRDRLHRAAVHD